MDKDFIEDFISELEQHSEMRAKNMACVSYLIRSRHYHIFTVFFSFPYFILAVNFLRIKSGWPNWINLDQDIPGE